LYDLRRQNLGYEYTDFHLQTVAFERSGLHVTICSEQLLRIEVKRVYPLLRIAWLLF
jgi:hypothetical protein